MKNEIEKRYMVFSEECKLNRVDAETVAGFLEKNGYLPSRVATDLDLVIFVACSFTQEKVDKMMKKVEILQGAKKSDKITIGLTGCYLPSDEKKIKSKFDFIFKIKDLERLPEIIRGVYDKDNTIAGSDYFKIRRKYTGNLVSIGIPIMTGCNSFCSYCAIPSARGAEDSRQVRDILNEISYVVSRGCVEIDLGGTTVNSYHPRDPENFSKKNPYKNSFAALLWEINNIKGIARIKFGTPHPIFMDDEFIDALKLRKIVNYLSIHIQSGDDIILKKMNRKYDSKYILELVRKIREVKPGIRLETDVIVGFPGESVRAFQNTYELFRKIGFDNSSILIYSERKGTYAQKHYPDDVLLEEKVARKKALKELQADINTKKSSLLLGRVVSVLVDQEKDIRKEGNSLEMMRVAFPAKGKYIGRIVDVKVEKVLAGRLLGRLVMTNRKEG